MDNDTPADEAATGAAPSMDELLNRRHQPQAAHEPHREVGAAPSDDDDGDSAGAGEGENPAGEGDQPNGAQVAAQPETNAAPAGNAGEPPPSGQAPNADEEPKGPRWYREHIKKVNAEKARLQRENEDLRTGRQSPQAPQPQPRPQPELPNPAEDPVGYANAILGLQQERFESLELATTLRLSERFARQQHGDTFDECFAWLQTRPDLEQHFVRQPDPWGAAIAYFQREKLAEEIGDDPAAYRKRIEEEVRAQIAAESGGQGSRSGMTADPPPQRRAAPPPPASAVRGAQPRDVAGRFSGAAPLKFRNFE